MLNAKNYECNTSDIQAHITTRTQKDGTIVLSGYAICADTGIRVDGSRRHQSRAKRQNDIDTTRKYLIGRIEREYLDKNRKNSADAVMQNGGLYSAAFKSIDDPTKLLSPKWCTSTAGTYLKYFMRQVLPRLDAFGRDICCEDVAEIKADLINKATHSKRGNQNPDQAKNSVSAYLTAADFIYNNMEIMTKDEYSLPKIDLSGDKCSNSQVEQFKALPNEIRVKLAALLLRIGNIGLALGVALMIYSGLRPAEAAAVKIGDILIMGDYGILPVLHQINKGKKTTRLKSEAGYRVVILPYIAVHLVNDYKSHLENAGYSKDEISEMPLASKRNAPDKYVDGSEVSAFAKKLLMLSGCNTDFLRAAYAMAINQPDFDVDGRPLKDVSAYILRRDWCTRASDICGIPRDAVDYYIGHARGDRNIDYINPDIYGQIASQLERYVFNPKFTLNPAFYPLYAKHGLDTDLLPSMSYNIKSTDENILEVQIDIINMEPDNIINLVLPCANAEISIKRSTKDDADNRANRPIIGKVYDAEYYDRLINHANMIDLNEMRGDLK